MSYSADLAKRIEDKLAIDEERKLKIKDELRKRHEVREQRLGRFAEIAGEIAGSLIRPRVELLASYFENAAISSPGSGCTHCVCRFETTPRFPASTTLELAISHDEAIENATVTYSLEILPVFLEHERRDSLTFTLDNPDEERLAQWVDDKIMTFVDTYLELEQIEQYQRQNMVVDPVCGIRFNKTAAAAEVTRAGCSYYFCSEDCHARFLDDAQRYLGAPRR